MCVCVCVCVFLFEGDVSLSQWLNFKLSGITGITCLVGKIKFKLLSQGPLAE